jgi:hypothetical protein
MNGVGPAGQKYVPGMHHRVDIMAKTGLYEDGKKGIRRPTDPVLRAKDVDRDGVQAEVLYGILGAAPAGGGPAAVPQRAGPPRAGGRGRGCTGALRPHSRARGRVGRSGRPNRRTGHGRP